MSDGGGGGSAPMQPTPQSYGGQPNYIPTDQQGFDQSYQTMMSSYQPAAQTFATMAPQAATAAQGVVSNPYAGQVLQGAQAGQQIATQVGIPEQVGGSQALYQQGQAAIPYANQALNQGFDPQQTLYNSQYQQMQQQQNAIAAQNGVSGSPYAAGGENQAAMDFNSNWQNQQLGREQTAAGTYNTLMNQAGTDFTAAGNMANQAVTGAVGAGSLAYAGYNAPLTTDISTIGAAGTAGSANLQPDLSGMQAAGQYMNLGQSASSSYDSAVNAAYQQNMQAWQADQQATQGMMSGIGSLGGMVSGGAGIGSLFSSIPGLFAGGTDVLSSASDLSGALSAGGGASATTPLVGLAA
jgi:hypothetical protein